jgi:ABC-type polysaccharide/polyol phosphate export permease
MSSTTNCIFDNASLIKKVIFPRQIIPVSIVFSQIIHLLIQLCLLFFFILIFRVPLSWTCLWLIPIYVVELLFILGLSLITSAVNVYYRDTQYLVASFLTVLFWFTPIFYALAMVRKNLHPALYALYLCNPLAGFVDASRQAVMYHTRPGMDSFGTAMVVTFLVCVVGWWLFMKKSKHFADKL